MRRAFGRPIGPEPGRPRTGRARVALLALLALGSGCARISEVKSLRDAPREKPRVTTEMRGKGYRLRGERDGGVVRLEVLEEQRCVTVTRQHADGFERTTRRAVGPSLTMQWVMGGLFAIAGGGIAGYAAANPPAADETGTFAVKSSSSAYLQAGIFGAVGLGLLVGSAIQTASLGVTERPLGHRELRLDGELRACGSGPARSGTVRLTLADGTQLEAEVDGEGHAVVTLPEDIEARLAREGRRATVEVLGDWRSQARLTL